MIRSRLTLLACCLIVGQFAGCATIESWRSPDRRTAVKAKDADSDSIFRDDDEEDAEDPWKFVGDEGRAGLDREQIPDPWFGKHLYSEKARAIERNLGYDH